MMKLSRIEVRASVQLCHSCGLANSCSGGVAFDGPSPNNVAVVGEAPGRQEDQQRRPFVGPSGKLLRSYLEGVGIGDPTYLNAVSCFPGRTPRPREISACRQNLWEQLQVIQPQYILLVGGISVNSWWPDIKITEIRGGWWQAPWVNSAENLDQGEGWSWCLATYHPAAVLRNKGLESQVKEDISRFADVALGKVGITLMDRCVKCGDGEITQTRWGVAYCDWCWPENRLRYGSGRLGKLHDAYYKKEGQVPPFVAVGSYWNGKFVDPVYVQGELL